MLKKFFLKSFIFIFIVLFVQMFVAHPARFPMDLVLLDYFLKKGMDVIYFGDSSTMWIDKADKSPLDMPMLLSQLLPKAKLGRVTHDSYQMDVYSAYAEYMIHKGYHPRFVIIPINLRSFSPEWERQPLWQFENEKFAVRFKDTFWIMFYQPLGVFKFFESPVSRYQYERTKVFNGEHCIGRIRDFDNPSYAQVNEEKTRKKLLFRYMYKLRPQNHKIQAMLSLAQRLKDNGTGVIFYITPVDIQTGVRYLGEDFLKRVTENTQLIHSLLAEKSLNVLDLSASLPTQYFAWQDGDDQLYPNEHLRLYGRMFVVKNLAQGTDLKIYQ